MSEQGESAGPPPLQAGPDSEGVSPFAGGQDGRSTVPRSGRSRAVLSAAKALSSVHSSTPQTWAGLGCLAGEKTGLWRLREKKLSHVGCPLCARHHAAHPCALDLSTLVKEGPPWGMRMGALEKRSAPPEKAPPPGAEPKFKPRSAGRL